MDNIELTNTSQLPLPPNNWIQTAKHTTKISDERKCLYIKAWNDVKEGRKTMYRAAKDYDLTFSTLWSWCQRDDINEEQPVSGRPSIFSQFLEKKMENFVIESARTGILMKFVASKRNNSFF